MIDILVYPHDGQWVAQVDQVPDGTPTEVLDRSAVGDSPDEAVRDLVPALGPGARYEVTKLDEEPEVVLKARKGSHLYSQGFHLHYLDEVEPDPVQLNRRGLAKRFSIHEAYEIRRNNPKYDFAFEPPERD